MEENFSSGEKTGADFRKKTAACSKAVLSRRLATASDPVDKNGCIC
jgi:hypothetical protein